MWPFYKTYYKEDWELLEKSWTRVHDSQGRTLGWELRVYLRNIRTGKSKILCLKTSEATFSYLSMDEVKQRLFARHGITLDLDANKLYLAHK